MPPGQGGTGGTDGENYTFIPNGNIARGGRGFNSGVMGTYGQDAFINSGVGTSGSWGLGGGGYSGGGAPDVNGSGGGGGSFNIGSNPDDMTMANDGDGFLIITYCLIFDTDGDGIPDEEDNCPTVANEGQTNSDNDALGDACDPDDDNDGCLDEDDDNPLVFSEDLDGDDLANDCDNDDDGDGFADDCDQDPLINNFTLIPLEEVPSNWICHPNNRKVYVCHNGMTLCINYNAVEAHLAHGDYLGECNTCSEIEIEGLVDQGGNDLDIGQQNPTQIHKSEFELLPNPANDIVSIRLEAQTTTNQIIIYDNLGQIVWSQFINPYTLIVEVDLPSAKYLAGIYTVVMINGDQTLAKRLILTK